MFLHANNSGTHTTYRDRSGNVRDGISPTTRKKLRSCLGLASYYRLFMPGFIKIARPLNEKTSDKAKLVWSEDIQSTFKELKVKLASAPVLAYYDYDKHSWYVPKPQTKQLVLLYPILMRMVNIIRYIMRAELYLLRSRIILHLKANHRCYFCIEKFAIIQYRTYSNCTPSTGSEISFKYKRFSRADRALVHHTSRVKFRDLPSSRTR